MLFYEVKIKYQRQTGEDNPAGVNETYLIEGLNMTDVEERLMKEIESMIFGDSEIQGCKKAQYYDIYPDPNCENWYKGRVEMITVDGDKETRKGVNVLLQANNTLDANKALLHHLNGYDCEVISVAKSPILDVLRAIN